MKAGWMEPKNETSFSFFFCVQNSSAEGEIVIKLVREFIQSCNGEQARHAPQACKYMNFYLQNMQKKIVSKRMNENVWCRFLNWRRCGIVSSVHHVHNQIGNIANPGTEGASTSCGQNPFVRFTIDAGACWFISAQFVRKSVQSGAKISGRRHYGYLNDRREWTHSICSFSFDFI